MKTYPLKAKDTLVVSINGAQWQTFTFETGDFANVGEATAEEVAKALTKGDLAASVNDAGVLVLATAVAGGHTSLEVDIERSTAAPALGLGGAAASARGEGLRAARLESSLAEPYALTLDSELALVIDGRRRRVVFDDGFTKGKATAAEVARIINAKKKSVADVGRDGQLILTSNVVGAGSELAVEPVAPGKTDAAPVLGLAGARDEPHRVEPARLVCGGQQAGIEAVNLTASPIELHLPSGILVLAAHGQTTLSPSDSGSGQLQRLIEQGFVRLASAQA